ncbi:hypothetical protein [Roseateles sp. BYS87W]|uniref:Uncharacterized protein n=1 Tax=Pelomonas baiyunensis TaxID=3299026 RepID=A0ABW7H4A3_9BURK
MLEVQLQQDLRTAAELLQRDLRRAGFRGVAANGVWAPPHLVAGQPQPARLAQASPYETLQTLAGGTELQYRYARAVGAAAMNGTNVVAANEEFGVRLNNRTLYLQLGAANGQPNWQPITDPDLVVIDAFTAQVDSQPVPLDDLCACDAGTPCPQSAVRRVTFTIKAHAAADAALTRTVTVSEKLRADAIGGSCP